MKEFICMRKNEKTLRNQDAYTQNHNAQISYWQCEIKNEEQEMYTTENKI